MPTLIHLRRIFLFSIFLLSGREYFAQCNRTISGNGTYDIGINGPETVCTSANISGTVRIYNGGIFNMSHDLNFYNGQGGSITIDPGGKIVFCGGHIKMGGSITVGAGGEIVMSAGTLLEMVGGSITASGTGDNAADPGIPFSYQGDPTCWAEVRVNNNQDNGTPNAAPFMQSTNGFDNASLTLSNRIYFTGKPWIYKIATIGAGRTGNPPNPLCGSPGSCFPCSNILPGSIGGNNQTICAGESPNTLTNITSASGGNGFSYSYQWQVSVNGGAYSNASGSSTSATYSPGVLAAGVYNFRRRVTSGSCGSGTTSPVTVTVNALPTITGSIGASRCATGTANISATSSAGSIRWYTLGGILMGSSNSGVNWTTPSVNSTTTYYAEAITGSCISSSRTAVTVNVTPTLSTGSIASNQSICYNTRPAGLTSSAASGGSGTYNYQWQRSTDGVNFSDIPGIISETYSPPSELTQNTWYQRAVTSGACGPFYTSAVAITVYADLAAGSIGSDQTIPSGSAPSSFTSIAAASGGGGFTYQWQSSTNGVNFFDIAGATSETYTHSSPLYINTDYRRGSISTSGCGIVYSDAVSVDVVVSLCSGSTPPNLVEQESPSGGVGGFTYQWQRSTDGVNFSDIVGATSETYNPNSVTSSTWYRRAVTSGTCTEYTPAVKAAVKSSPGGVGNGLLVWLKADQGTDNIGTKWEDQSGNGNHYTTVSGPILSAGDSSSNYNPFIEINSGGFNAPQGTELGEEYTIICVAKKMESDANGRIFDGHMGDYAWGYWGEYSNALNTNDNPSQQNSGSATNIHHKGMQSFIRKSNSNLEHRINGNSVAIYSSSANASGVRVDINQGAFAANESSDSRVYEVIIYNSVLSAEDLLVVESYLMTKYRLGKNHNYVTSTGAMSFDISSYNNDIIGLGKECYFHQKQSESQDDSTRIFISNLAATNSVNTGSVTNDVSYLFMGHNKGKLSLVNTEKPDVIGYRLGREWKIMNTNFSNEYSIEIEYKDLGTFELSDLRLLVDDDGDFSDATVYGTSDGLTFNYGSIIIGGLDPSIIGVGTTKFITIGLADNILPIKMVGFKATQQNEHVELTWTTLSEINNAYFSIQKRDGESNEWLEIERLPGQDFSDHNIDYIVYDEKGCEGQCYYRLVQIDHDETTTKSHIITISDLEADKQKEIELKLYPNPTEDILYISLESPLEGHYNIKIYQTDGRIVMNTTGKLHYGRQTLEVNVHGLQSGLYYIDFTDDTARKRSSATFNRR